MMQQDKGYSVFLPQFVYILGNKDLFRKVNSYFQFDNIIECERRQSHLENKMRGYEIFVLKRNDGKEIKIALDSTTDQFYYNTSQAYNLYRQVENNLHLTGDLWCNARVPHKELQRISYHVNQYIIPKLKGMGEIYDA